MHSVSPAEALVDERTLSKLRWRCRRGLLENDLFVERFFARHAASLTERQALGLQVLMDLSDNDLLDDRNCWCSWLSCACVQAAVAAPSAPLGGDRKSVV